jgi:hypothetical protein
MHRWFVNTQAQDVAASSCAHRVPFPLAAMGGPGTGKGNGSGAWLHTASWRGGTPSWQQRRDSAQDESWRSGAGRSSEPADGPGAQKPQAAAVWRQERRQMEAASVVAKVVNADRAKRALLGNEKRARRCPPRRRKPRQRAANAASTLKLDCPATRWNIDGEGECATGHPRSQLVCFINCHVAIHSVRCLLCNMVLANGMSRQHCCSHVLSTCARAGMCLNLFGG